MTKQRDSQHSIFSVESADGLCIVDNHTQRLLDVLSNDLTEIKDRDQRVRVTQVERDGNSYVVPMAVVQKKLFF